MILVPFEMSRRSLLHFLQIARGSRSSVGSKLEMLFSRRRVATVSVTFRVPFIMQTIQTLCLLLAWLHAVLLCAMIRRNEHSSQTIEAMTKSNVITLTCMKHACAQHESIFAILLFCFDVAAAAANNSIHNSSAL